MIQRVVAAILLVWMLGFLLFSVTLPGSAGAEVADAVVVPTGAAGRIQRGLEVLEGQQAGKFFVSGVDPDVTAKEFAAEFGVEEDLMDCCVELGFEASDTQGNAEEIADWVAREDINSVRLVTSDWHMRRAAGELEHDLPSSVAVIRDAVASRPSVATLFLEYHKYLASSVRTLFDL